MKIQSQTDTDLLCELKRRIVARDDIANLCGEILATLRVQRNQQPLTDAGVLVDNLLDRWERRLKEYDDYDRTDGKRVTCPVCGGTVHADPPSGTVGKRCVKCCGLSTPTECIQ